MAVRPEALRSTVTGLVGTARTQAAATVGSLAERGAVVVDGGLGLLASGVDQADDGAADGLRPGHGRELLRRGAGAVDGLVRPGHGLGGPGARLLDGQVRLDLGLAGERLGARADPADGGEGALDGQVTGADGSEERGLGGSTKVSP